MYLAGYLEKNGFKTEIVDVILGDQVRDKEFFDNWSKKKKAIEKESLKRVRRASPDMVGITCYTPELFEVLDIARKIKGINKKIKVVVGGVHPTFYPNDFIYEGSPVDAVVLGEGEGPMLELAKKMDKRRLWSNIKSIGYWDEEKKQRMITDKMVPCQDLDSLSCPAYHLVDMKYYTTANPYAIRGVFTRCAYVLSSRGCPSSCTFCVSKRIREVSGGGSYIRFRSAEHLFKEVKKLKKEYKIDSFYFVDDLFGVNKNLVKDFCRLLRQSKLGLIWGCSSKVTALDYQTLKMMRRAGCIQIDFGVERGSNQSLQVIKKGISVELIEKVFDDCHKLRIRTFANMLINLPGETDKDLEDITSLLDRIRPTIVSINVFTPYPGTELFEQMARKITKKEYADSMKGMEILIKKQPRKYRFAAHKMDVVKWAKNNNRRYNRL